MLRLIRDMTLAGIGALELARETAKKRVDELVKRGEASQDERTRLVRDILDRLQARSEEFRRRVDERMEKRTSRIRMARKKDIEELSQKVDSLTEQIAKLEKAARAK